MDVRIRGRDLHQPGEQVEAAGAQHDGRQARVVAQHHHQHGQGHEAVHADRHQALGQGILNRAEGAESGGQITQMPLLKPVQRQPQHVRQEVAGELERHQVGQAHDQPTAQQLGRELDGQNAEEAERQQADQFTVRMGNALGQWPTADAGALRSA